jgi:hypothetical protein
VRSFVDYAILLYLSRIHVRSIWIDMGVHLAFLVTAVLVARYLTSYLGLAGAAAIFVLVNVAWSMYSSPGFRGFMRGVFVQIGTTLRFHALVRRASGDRS